MIKYFIRQDGAYVEGDETDFQWVNYGENSTEVPRRPGPEYEWINDQWTRTQESLISVYFSLRISELRRTDIYRRDASLTPGQIIERDAYYAALIGLDFSDPDNFEFPVCPEFMKD